MNFFVVAVAVLVFSIVASLWGCLATRIASSGKAGPPIDEVFQFALASGFISTPVMFDALNDGDTLKAGIGLLLGILLGVSATVDRLTAWAPDGLMVPITLLACLYGPIGSYGPLWALAAGGLTFFAAQGLWYIQVQFNKTLLPPPDLIALFIPFALFGIGFESLAIMILISVLLLLVLRFPDLEFLSGLQEAKEDAREDTGMQGGTTIAFLATAFPITLLVWGFTTLTIFAA